MGDQELVCVPSSRDMALLPSDGYCLAGGVDVAGLVVKSSCAWAITKTDDMECLMDRNLAGQSDENRGHACRHTSSPSAVTTTSWYASRPKLPSTRIMTDRS